MKETISDFLTALCSSQIAGIQYTVVESMREGSFFE